MNKSITYTQLLVDSLREDDRLYLCGIAVGKLYGINKNVVKFRITTPPNARKLGGVIVVAGSQTRGYIAAMESQIQDLPDIAPMFFERRDGKGCFYKAEENTDIAREPSEGDE